MGLKLNSLGARLFAAFLLIILVVLLIVGLALLVLLRNSPLVERQAITRLTEVARAAPLTGGDPPVLAAQAERYVQDLARNFDVRVLIVTARGVIQADSARAGAPPLRLAGLALARAVDEVPGGQTGQAWDTDRGQWVYVARPLGPNRLLVFALPQPRFPVLAFFTENLLRPLVQAGLAAVACAAVLAALIARSVARPLQQMAQAAQGIARGDYARSAPEGGPEEVAALGQSFNRMARQVQATQQAERDFVANVSHDLKTPLTSIQGFAQALLDGTAATAEARERAAHIIFTEADRLRRLVESLMDLARLDASLAALARAPVDLPRLLRAALDRFDPQARAKQLTLQAEIPESLPALSGDADRLAQVFTNLLDNALQHTPAGGRVTLSARAGPTGVEVRVADTGPGIPAQDLQRIFERFYQVEKSRAQGSARGAGLGLAISREIVRAHGGRLHAESPPGQGAVFILFLPTGRLK